MDFKTIFFCCQLILSIPHISCQQNSPHPEAPLLKEARRPPPARILSHSQAQTHDGGFKFAYRAENGLAQSEVIAPDGTRNGGYTYIDSLGKKITVRYSAGKDGFKILNEGDSPQQAMPYDHQEPRQQNYEPQPQQHPQKQYLSYEPQQNYQPQPNYKKQYLGFESPKLQFAPPKTVKAQYQYVPSKPAGPVKLNYQYNPLKQAAPIKANYQYSPGIKYEVPMKPQYQYIPARQENEYAQQGEPQVKRDAPAQDDNTVEQEVIEPEYNDEPGQPYSFGTGYSFAFSN